MASYIGASAEQESADPILVAFAAEAAKGDPASPVARELVLRWRDHLAKFSRSCDDEKLRRLADLYSWGRPLLRGAGQLRSRHRPLHGRGHRGLSGHPVTFPPRPAFQRAGAPLCRRRAESSPLFRRSS